MLPSASQVQILEKILDLAHTFLLGIKSHGIPLVCELADTLKKRAKALIVRKPPSYARGVLKQLSQFGSYRVGAHVAIRSVSEEDTSPSLQFISILTLSSQKVQTSVVSTCGADGLEVNRC